MTRERAAPEQHATSRSQLSLVRVVPAGRNSFATFATELRGRLTSSAMSSSAPPLPAGPFPPLRAAPVTVFTERLSLSLALDGAQLGLLGGSVCAASWASSLLYRVL